MQLLPHPRMTVDEGLDGSIREARTIPERFEVLTFLCGPTKDRRAGLFGVEDRRLRAEDLPGDPVDRWRQGERRQADHDATRRQLERLFDRRCVAGEP